MDPGTGTLYASYDAALLAGVTSPVELVGRPEDVERISEAVAVRWAREQKDAPAREKMPDKPGTHLPDCAAPGCVDC